jgi:putative redox protein
MAVTISVSYHGQLRCTAIRQPDGQSVQTDIIAAHGGRGEYLTPAEMTVAAVATCAVSMAAAVAERSGIDLSTAKATAQFDMVDKPHRRIGPIRLSIQLPRGVPEAARPKLEAAAKACPVKNSLHPDIGVEIEFIYG